MKNKRWIGYLGYGVSLLLVLLIALTHFPREIDLALCILFSVIFAVSHTQLLHAKMLHTDEDYKINILDERNIAIKEKTGNVMNMVTLVLLGMATVLFIALNYIIPAVIIGGIVFIQPIIMIFISIAIEKKI